MKSKKTPAKKMKIFTAVMAAPCYENALFLQVSASTVEDAERQAFSRLENDLSSEGCCYEDSAVEISIFAGMSVEESGLQERMDKYFEDVEQREHLDEERLRITSRIADCVKASDELKKDLAKIDAEIKKLAGNKKLGA
jgi:hypothetical protein